METGILKALENQSGAVIVAGFSFFFFWKITVNFTEVIRDFANKVTNISEKNNEVSRDLARQLQEFSDTNRQLSESLKEQKNISQKLYVRLYEKSKKNS